MMVQVISEASELAGQSMVSGSSMYHVSRSWRWRNPLEYESSL